MNDAQRKELEQLKRQDAMSCGCVYHADGTVKKPCRSLRRMMGELVDGRSPMPARISQPKQRASWLWPCLYVPAFALFMGLGSALYEPKWPWIVISLLVAIVAISVGWRGVLYLALDTVLALVSISAFVARTLVISNAHLLSWAKKLGQHIARRHSN